MYDLKDFEETIQSDTENFIAEFIGFDTTQPICLQFVYWSTTEMVIIYAVGIKICQRWFKFNAWEEYYNKIKGE